MNLNVGDKVLHVSRDELGYGEITAIHDKGTCDVTFPDASFSGLPLSKYVSAEEFIEASMRAEIEESIRLHDFDGAEKIHLTYSRDANTDYWPDFSEHLEKARREHEERIAIEERKAEQLKRQTEVINQLLDRIFIEAEQKAVFPYDEWHVNFGTVKKNWLKNHFAKSTSSKLSDEQLRAIGNCDDSVLLRARAGSGKTTVIKHKVDFAVRHLGIDPSEIMVLAFNKIAAGQVRRDLHKDFNHLTFNNARTFHSLAYRIAQPSQDLLFDVDSGSNAKQSQFIESLLEKENNPRFRKDLYQFFRAEMTQLENIGSLLSKEDYYTLMRNEAQDTLGGDPVKSIGEKWIADFLFEHDIRYMYERPWYRDKSGKQGNYHPDFSLAVHSRIPDVVIEHWGIDEFDESEAVPEHWDKTWFEYFEEMEIKREYWSDWNEKNPSRPVVFVETSVLNTREGRVQFEDHLKQLLSSAGVNCTKLSEEILIEKVVRKHIARFSRMVLQYLQRAKKQRLSPEGLDHKIAEFDFETDNGSERGKEKVFCLIANRIYHRYANELKSANLIDFDDLMALAVERIERQHGDVVIDPTSDSALNLNSLRWLMVDEFQDFSPLFFNLISVLRSHNPKLKLFCVGDDWQAINGFAGSDLTYFNDFGLHFSDAVLLDLRNNYRSQPNIVDQGNAFMANKNGAPSIAKAGLPWQQIRLIHSNTVFIDQRPNVPVEENPDRAFMTHRMSRGELTNLDTSSTMARLFKICFSIMSTYPLNSTKFMILNRGNYLGYTYESMSKFKAKLKSCFTQTGSGFKNFDAQVDCLTAHRSKGEEADVVIILNALDRKFPIIHSDNELYRLLGMSIEEVYAEEERLFYVAITRAKRALYIITEKKRESAFLDRVDYSTIDLNSLKNGTAELKDEIPF